MYSCLSVRCLLVTPHCHFVVVFVYQMSEAKLKAEFLKLTRMKYAEQAKWYLNGFWKDGAQQEAETVWSFGQGFIKFDEKKVNGNELDEFWSHKFLESIGETLTILELREKLKKIDMDVNGKMGLLEFLAFYYHKTVKQVVEAPQGQNAAQIREASDKLEAVQSALVEQQTALEKTKVAEETVKKAEGELKVAVEDLRQQEETFRVQLEKLETKANDESASTVARNKAAAELSQLKNENPLPLRKAKITQDAALRRVERDSKAAETARLNLEKKIIETEKTATEAEAFLDQLKRQPANPFGSIWWLERELTEAQKFLPKKKK